MKEELEDHMKLLLGHQETMKDIEKVRGQGCRAIGQTAVGVRTAWYHSTTNRYCRVAVAQTGRSLTVC